MVFVSEFRSVEGITFNEITCAICKLSLDRINEKNIIKEYGFGHRGKINDQLAGITLRISDLLHGNLHGTSLFEFNENQSSKSNRPISNVGQTKTKRFLTFIKLKYAFLLPYSLQFSIN